MMFLQFFVWGAWYVTTGNFMSANGMGDSVGWAYSLCPIAAVISPFFLGMIADRFFASEKILGVLHLIGGIIMFALPSMASTSTYVFLLGIQLYALCYMPTLSLSSTVAFSNIKNSQTWFPIIRSLGTIGWIVAGIMISKWLGADKKSIQYTITGGASVLLGVLSFFMPHTPPPAKGKPLSIHDILCMDAWKLLKDKYFAIFAVCSMLICIPLSAYYAYAQVFVDNMGFEAPAYTMSFGQMGEVLCMFLIPLFFVRLGAKWMLAVGMFAWILRYGFFGYAASSGILWMVVAGVILHGICYDFFFVTGQIYTDQRTSKSVRAQAQGFLVFLTQGVGMLIGAQIMQLIYNRSVNQYTDLPSRMAEWDKFWYIPAIFAAVVLVLFIILFKVDKRPEAA